MTIKTFINTAIISSLLVGSICHADTSHGQATGKRQHKPVSITKEIDKSTPMIANSMLSNSISSQQKAKTAYKLCPDGTMINPGEKCPEKSAKK